MRNERVLTADLFAGVPDARPPREPIAEGAVLLRGFAKPFEDDLLAALRDIMTRTVPNWMPMLL